MSQLGKSNSTKLNTQQRKVSRKTKHISFFFQILFFQMNYEYSLSPDNRTQWYPEFLI